MNKPLNHCQKVGDFSLCCVNRAFRGNRCLKIWIRTHIRVEGPEIHRFLLISAPERSDAGAHT